jgi:hypothetical protein
MTLVKKEHLIKKNKEIFIKSFFQPLFAQIIKFSHPTNHVFLQSTLFYFAKSLAGWQQ